MRLNALSRRKAAGRGGRRRGAGDGRGGGAARPRLVLAVLVALLSFAVIAQPVLSMKDDERVVERDEASRPGAQPKVLEEIAQDRTRTSKTFATDDGGRTVKVFPEPVHFENANGTLQAIDNDLVESPIKGFALRNRANRFVADLPAEAGRTVRFAVGDDVVRFALRGARGGGRKLGEQVRYAAALPSVDVTYDMRPQGIKETLILRDRRAVSDFVFDVDLSQGLRMREAGGGAIEIVRDQEPVARFEAPFAFDQSPGHGDDAVEPDPHAKLRVEGDRLRLSVDRDWLDDKDRSFPVVVDPTVTYIDGSAKSGGAAADTYVSSDNPATSYGTSAVMAAGYGINGNTVNHDHRALLRFDVAGAVPPDSVVFSATLGLYAERQENANAGALRVREVSRSWTEAASWSKYDGTNAWSAPGGDVAAFASLGVQPAVGWSYWKDLQPLAERWVHGSSANNGLLVERCCGAPDNVYEFTSSNGAQAQWPYLQIWYTHRAGSTRQNTFWHPDGTVTDGVDPDREALNSLPEVNVDVASGNLFFRAKDRVSEAPGGIELTRNFNSVWWGTNNMGRGWSLDNADITLTDFHDGNVRLDGPGDTPVLFKRKSDGTYEKGQGFASTLERATDGTTDWWVTLHDTGERYVFGGINVRVAKRYIDAGGGVSSLSNHSDGKSFIVTDGLGKSTNIIREQVPFLSAGWFRVTRLEAPGQTFTYTYDANNNLASATAPDGKITRYAYQQEAGPDGLVYDKRLVKVTKPDGSEIRFTYGPAWGGRQIASHTTRAPGATVDGPTTRFEYRADRTLITAPNGAVSTYLWDKTRRVTSASTGASAPTLSATGTLVDNQDKTFATNAEYTLNVSAQDGSATVPSQGVKSIETLVDGERIQFAEQPCTAGNCTMSRSILVRTDDFEQGAHVLTTVVTDHGGARTTRSVRFAIDHGDYEDVALIPAGDPSPVEPDAPTDPPETVVDEGTVPLSTRLRCAPYDVVREQHFITGSDEGPTPALTAQVAFQRLLADPAVPLLPLSGWTVSYSEPTAVTYQLLQSGRVAALVDLYLMGDSWKTEGWASCGDVYGE